MQLVVAPDTVVSNATCRSHIDTNTSVSSMSHDDFTATPSTVVAYNHASTHHHQRNAHHQHVPHVGSDTLASVYIGWGTLEL